MRGARAAPQALPPSADGRRRFRQNATPTAGAARSSLHAQPSSARFGHALFCLGARVRGWTLCLLELAKYAIDVIRETATAHRPRDVWDGVTWLRPRAVPDRWRGSVRKARPRSGPGRVACIGVAVAASACVAAGIGPISLPGPLTAL